MVLRYHSLLGRPFRGYFYDIFRHIFQLGELEGLEPAERGVDALAHEPVEAGHEIRQASIYVLHDGAPMVRQANRCDDLDSRALDGAG